MAFDRMVGCGHRWGGITLQHLGKNRKKRFLDASAKYFAFAIISIKVKPPPRRVRPESHNPCVSIILKLSRRK